jgi:hypothetical protein
MAYIKVVIVWNHKHSVQLYYEYLYVKRNHRNDHMNILVRSFLYYFFTSLAEWLHSYLLVTFQVYFCFPSAVTF